jgi:capsular polysaccharide biosynthesis protein
MSQQALDLRRSIQIVRRRKKLFGAVVTLGLLIGAGYAVLKPPMLTSTALVVLPQATAQSGQSASGTGSTGPDIATQIVVASSIPVLSGALPHVSPAMSLQTLENRVQVTSVAGSILSISASGGTAADAEATANAVANSYVSYVTAATSPVGHVSASILQSAATATGPKLPSQIALYGLLGALAGALVGFILSLAISRNNRRLVERDAIANSIGAPVLVSVPVGHPSDAASWSRLLEEYEPGAVHAYGLGHMLRQFGAVDAGGNGARAGGASLTVLSLASDPGALSLGPQLAAFAAAQGIPTALVIGPQQDMDSTATLRTACAAAAQSGGSQRKPLRLIVSDDGRLGQLRAAFVVVVTVVDGRAPRMPDTVHTSATVLGVSAGAATAEELARAATAAAVDGREIVGILVADPEPSDQTTGRIPHLASPVRRQMPTRVKDVPTETRR